SAPGHDPGAEPASAGGLVPPAGGHRGAVDHDAHRRHLRRCRRPLSAEQALRRCLRADADAARGTRLHGAAADQRRRRPRRGGPRAAPLPARFPASARPACRRRLGGGARLFRLAADRDRDGPAARGHAQRLAGPADGAARLPGGGELHGFGPRHGLAAGGAMTISLIAFAVLLVMVFARIPIAFAMAIVGGVGFALLRGWGPAGAMVGNAVFETGLNYSLSVVP